MQNEALAYFSRRGRPVVAASSALGGPVAVIRISGERLDFLQTLIGKFPAPNSFKYSSVHSSDSLAEVSEIDRALVLYFQAPHSFTGEDVIEIQSHGVPSLVERIISSVVAEGAERALPGEFSFRAFMNSKMQLGDAERLQTALSTEGLSGAWASKLLNVTKDSAPQLVQIFRECLESLQSARGRIEASIDFPEAETEQAADLLAAQTKIEHSKGVMNRFLSSYYQFCRSAGESRVVIVGDPNVGKSSLMNALVGGSRALVSPTAGTTRDVVESRLRGPKGNWFRLLDTAGIREVSEEGAHARLEKAGIELGLESLQLANVVIWVRSLQKSDLGMNRSYVEQKLPTGSQLIELHSFADKVSAVKKNSYNFNKLESNDIAQILGLVENAMEQVIERQDTEKNDLIISRRQGQLLEKALEEVERAHQALLGQFPIEISGDSLRVAESYLKHCIGEDLGDEYIGQIFSQFCLGK